MTRLLVATWGPALAMGCLVMPSIARAQPPVDEVAQAEQAEQENRQQAGADSNDTPAAEEDQEDASEGEAASSTSGGASDGGPERSSQPDAEVEAEPEGEAGGADARYPDADLHPDAVVPSGEGATLLGESGEATYPSEISAAPQLGTRYTLERIEIRGLERTSQAVVRQYIDLEAGEIIRPSDDQVERVEWSVRSTGWFSQVSVHLERGRERGHVVIVVEVEERNTIVLRNFTFGVSEGVSSTIDSVERVRLYVGASISERNLFGTGAQLTLSGLGSARARGLRLDYEHPFLFGSLDLIGAFYYNNAHEYFGNNPMVDVTCPIDPEERCEPENAVVSYKRGGISLGVGIRGTLRTRITWLGERISTRSLPNAASEDRGGNIVPIDFSVLPDVSYLSALQFETEYDRRDDPVFPREGTHIRFSALLAHSLIGSDYQFVRLYGSLQQSFPIRDRHAIRLGLRGGLILGDAPFFAQFHVSDFTDFIPSRYLEMELDRRRSLNLFGTSAAVMQQQDLAGRVDVEYSFQLFRSTSGVRAVDLYFNAGAFALGDVIDARRGFPDYQGASAFPVDLTLDFGIRAELGFGMVQLGFSNVFGFLAI